MSEERVIFYDFGEFRLDVVNYRLLKNGSPVQLTHKSFEILHELITNRDRMLRKEELLNKIWEDCYVEEATLTQHIYMLRKALQQNGKIYIETVPKSGYRFVAEVEEIIPVKTDSNEKAENNSEETSKSFSELTEEKNEPETAEFVKPLPVSGIKPVQKRLKFQKFIPLFIAFLILAIVSGIFLYLHNAGAPSDTKVSRIKTIAVLPFKQIAEKEDEKLGLGMADVLITKLGKASDIEVLPTSAIIRYAGKDAYDLTEAGKNLGVDAVLTGTIQHDQNAVRITVQFYNVETRSFLWTEKFDEKMNNIFILQDSISDRISEELALRINNNATEEVAENYTKNIEAHQAYSMGLYHWNQRTEEGLKKAVEYFESSVNSDPNFALGYAYLADTYSLIVYYRINEAEKENFLQKAKQAARKALELDPKCSEAMTALATINTGENRVEESFGLLKKAIEIKPNNAAARQRIAWMYAHQDNLEKAIDEMKTAQNLDPQARATNIGLAQLLNVARRPDEAVAFLRRVLEFNPNDETAKLRLAESFEQMGNLDEAEKLVRENLGINAENMDTHAALSRLLAKKGDKKEALKIVQNISNSKNANSFNYESALVYTVLGENEKAIELLRNNSDQSGFIKMFLKNDYNLDPLRQNPAFAEIIK